MPNAKDIMTPNPFTVKKNTPVRDLAKELVEKNYSGAPVVDDSGKVVGVVTESDLIDQHKNIHLPTVITLFDSVITFEGPFDLKGQIKKIIGSTVEDIMTGDVVTVDEDTSLEDIATIMSEKKKHLIPVLRGSELVGVIDRSDVVKGIIKSE